MSKLLFGLLGCIGIVGAIFLPNVQDESISANQNALFNYYFRVALSNFSLLMFLLPYLMKKGFVHLDYYNASKYEKAQSEFIIITILIPGIAILSYIFFNVVEVRKELLGVVLFVGVYRYLECIYILLFKKRIRDGG